MKKLLLILVIVSISFVPSFSQNNEMKGIGAFKIGVLKIESLDSICKTLRIKKANDITSNQMQNQFGRAPSSKYAQIVFDQNYADDAAFDAPMHPDIKRFLFSKYEINDIILNNFLLTFYQGKLAEINFKGDLDKVEEIFKAKYGEPKTKLAKESKTFVFTYTGNTIDKEGGSIETIWFNGSIKAEKYSHLGYSSYNGSPLVVEYFDISDTIIGQEILNKNAQGYKDWGEKKDKMNSDQNKKRYPDF